MANAMQLRKQAGFTLIELVTVIVILGILASFALPKFVAIDAKARLAALRSLEGSLRSASALAHSLSLASGSPSTITVEGASVAMAYGYPTVGAIDDMLQSYDGYTLSATTTVATFTPGGTSDTNCKVTYTPPTAAGSVPAIALGSASPTCD